jgi:hypothetical protein
MHGQQTIKYLNDKAVADVILAKKPAMELSPKQATDFQEALVKKAQENATK